MSDEDLNTNQEVVEEYAEPKPKALRKQASPMIPVKLVDREGKTVLAEYFLDDQGVLRCWIPLQEVVQDEGVMVVPLTTLEAGAHYGVDWSKLEIRQITSGDLSRELRRAGIFTVDDILANKPAVMTAIIRLAGITVGDMIKQMRKSKKE